LPKEYEFWSQETEDMFLKIIKDSGFQTDIANDPNYLYDFNDRFANGKLGTKSCNF